LAAVCPVTLIILVLVILVLVTGVPLRRILLAVTALLLAVLPVALWRTVLLPVLLVALWGTGLLPVLLVAGLSLIITAVRSVSLILPRITISVIALPEGSACYNQKNY
jgi:hypothetical protein